MLNDEKKENGFLDALNNIDDDLVDEVTETAVRPNRAEQTPKRSSLMRIAFAAASLAAMAAVCIGVISVMRDLPSTPPGEETLEETVAVSESTDKNNVVEKTEQNTEPPVVTTAAHVPPDSSGENHGNAEEMLKQEEWKNIDNYINAASEEGYSQIAQLNGFNIANLDTETGMTTGVLFDRKTFKDEYEIALLGFKVWKDDDAYADTVTVKELRIALVKSGEITASMPVYNPRNPDAPVCFVERKYFDKYTEMCDNIVIFRSLFNCRIPEVLFFNIYLKNVSLEYKEGYGYEYEYQISQCVRSDVPDGSRREDRSEILSPVIYKSIANITTTEECYEVFIIGDDLTETEYGFLGDTYTVEQKDRLHDEFKPFDLNSVPVIEEFFYEDIEDIIGTLAHDMIICEKRVGEYTLLTVGNNFRRTENGPVFFYNPQTIITKGNYHLAVIPTVFPEMGPYKCSLTYSDNGDYSRYAMNAFMLGDTLFLFDNNSVNGSYDIGKIYAFNGDYNYVLSGNYDGVNGNPPLWTEGKKGYDLTVAEDSLSFVYGFKEYRLELGDNGEYSYSVSWLESPVE